MTDQERLKQVRERLKGLSPLSLASLGPALLGDLLQVIENIEGRISEMEVKHGDTT